MNDRERAPRSTTTGDPDLALVLPRIDRRVVHGTDCGAAAIVEGRFAGRDGERFEAEIVRVQLGGMVLRRASMTAHRALMDGADDGWEADVLRLVAVQQGTLHVAPLGGRPIRMAVGDALLTSRSRVYAYQANGPVVVVESTLPVSSLPSVVQRLEALPVGLLPHSPLVDAVVALLSDLAGRLDEPWTFDADYAARGLTDLETAILTELIAPPPPLPGPDRVYSAALDYIERHLADRELGPPQIAEALGVSLRYLHRAFADKELTVARLLRERRLEGVAAALRTGDRPPQLQRIAERFGFGSQDRLARAFRRRYGMSITEYRSALPR